MKLNKDVMKTKARILVIVSIVGVLVSIIIMSTPAYSATFKGQVIDSDTKEPIAGAVVVASWNEERATLTDGGTRFKDVKETLTDKDGKWNIDGLQGRFRGKFISIISFVTGMYITRPPEFIIFKPGYCSWPEGFHVEACKGKVRPDGNNMVIKGETIELPRLVSREDRLRSIPSPADGKLEKQIELIKLINDERRNFGLKGVYTEIYQELPK